MDPASANIVTLRERRTISVTLLFLVLVAIALFISNFNTGLERDNFNIALATSIIFFSIYLQAYYNQQLLASQLPIISFWLVMTLSMMAGGILGNMWTWLLCLPVVAALMAGRLAGVVWTIICIITLWLFAYLQTTGFEFEFGDPLSGPEPLTLAFQASLLLLLLSAVIYVFLKGQSDAEAKLNSAVNQLQKEVQDRTLAEKEARQAEHTKATFLAAMSHELRTPLNGVIGASQLLMGDELSSRKRELVEVVMSSSETLLDLVNNVLDMSRLDSNTTELESIRIDFRDLVNSTLKSLIFQAEEKGLKFSLVIEDDVERYVLGDPTRLRQIFLNVVSNAIKFTAEGEISVTVDVALDRIRIRISDTGIGISEQVQEKLFEPYVQADPSTIRIYGGSGLGLTIVKGLVAAMKGAVDVTSELGKGTTFTIYLPLEAAPEASEQAIVKEEIELPAMNVLVADDNAVNRMVLSRMLEEDGHKVASLENGKEVVDYLPDHQVDLILMDLQMPVMNGVAAVRRIRAMSGDYSTTPVIAVTANIVRESPEDVIAAGMTAILAKPFTRHELRVALRDALASVPSPPD